MRYRSSSVFLLVLLTFFLGPLSGCGSKGWSKLSHKQMRSILLDVSLTSSLFDIYATPDSTRIATMAEVLQRHGVSQVDWDSSLSWYSKNDLIFFHDMYSRASDSLSKLRTQLQEEQDRRMRIEEHKNGIATATIDSVNFLGDSVLFLTPQGQFLNRHFSIIPSQPYDSTYRVNLAVRLLGMPKLKDSLTLRLALHLSDSTAIVQTKRIARSGLYTLSLNVPDGKTMIRMTGYLRGILPRLKYPKSFAIDSLSLVRLPNQPQSTPVPAVTTEVADTPATEEAIEL